MRLSYLVSAVLAVGLPVLAGDVSGHARITKRLSKKALPSVVYNLRGTAPPIVPADSEPVNEFDRVVVMLSGAAARPPAPVTATIGQRNSRFEPDILVVPVGSTVQFPNYDAIFHNVFSLSHAQSFDLGYYPQGQSRSVKFNRPGIVQVYCHIHSHMYAAIMITDSPWYGKPSPDGSFSFSNVPAGHYHVTAWHKVAGMFKTDVDVPQTGTAEVTIHIPVDAEQHL